MPNFSQVGGPLLAPDAETYAGFGRVALSRDGLVLAVGAQAAATRGQVYIYDRVQGAWSLRGTLTPPGAWDWEFGIGVALDADGSTLAVGATSAGDVGGVYLYDWSGSTWVRRAAMVAPATQDLSQFGWSLALSSNGAILAVGCKWDYSQGGTGSSVWLFDWDGDAWIERGSLYNGDALGFGVGVALSSDGIILAVGEDSYNAQGAVRVYDWSGSQWNQRGGVLQPGDIATSDYFGSSVSLSADGAWLAVGAIFWEGTLTNQGGVYLYGWNGAAWSQEGDVLVASDYAGGDRFGSGVALSGDGMTLMVGAENAEGSYTDQGQAYFFTAPLAYAVTIGGVLGPLQADLTAWNVPDLTLGISATLAGITSALTLERVSLPRSGHAAKWALRLEANHDAVWSIPLGYPSHRLRWQDYQRARGACALAWEECARVACSLAASWTACAHGRTALAADWGDRAVGRSHLGSGWGACVAVGPVALALPWGNRGAGRVELAASWTACALGRSALAAIWGDRSAGRGHLGSGWGECVAVGPVVLALPWEDQAAGRVDLAASWGEAIPTRQDCVHAWQEAAVARRVQVARWEDYPSARGLLAMVYGDRAAARSPHAAPWAGLTAVGANHAGAWYLTAPARRGLTLAWTLRERPAVQGHHQARWAVLEDINLISIDNVPEVLWQGQRIAILAARLSADEDSPVWIAEEIVLADSAVWSEIALGDELSFSIHDETWRLRVDGKGLSRPRPGDLVLSLSAVSPLAWLDAPYAAALTLDNAGEAVSAQATVAALVAPVGTLRWELDDWLIPAGALALSETTPLRAAREIVAAIGGVLESDPDGTPVARWRHPVAVPDYAGATPDQVIVDGELFTFQVSASPLAGFNRVVITNEDLSGEEARDRLAYFDEDANPYDGELRAWPNPWRAVTLGHTGHPDTAITPLGERLHTQTELVEFIAGQGQVEYPVQSLVSVAWQHVDLGPVSAQGTALTATVAAQSLAWVTYTSRSLDWQVGLRRDEAVQFVLI